ncbi:uncharacterized protein LOC122571664 isoform X3 [Bombus pyrosoma]|uniref:uncharacterized protein LOC122571664 isoform X3 n=1 Tax=Bombus pyrosoma TaxID=396416 RepID=UPI001CB9B17B|nr:uncharacterized protein LOC122571664 isoform X3 [Bombus pyrosoma]
MEKEDNYTGIYQRDVEEGICGRDTSRRYIIEIARKLGTVASITTDIDPRRSSCIIEQRNSTSRFLQRIVWTVCNVSLKQLDRYFSYQEKLQNECQREALCYTSLKRAAQLWILLKWCFRAC